LPIPKKQQIPLQNWPNYATNFYTILFCALLFYRPIFLGLGLGFEAETVGASSNEQHIQLVHDFYLN
jgi:hypothetical protein